jgi:hypothetical protein
MRKTLLFLAFISCGISLYGQRDTTLSNAQRRSIRVHYMQGEGYAITGKICGLRDSSICFNTRPNNLTNPHLINISIADIKSIKVRGKRNFIPSFILGALIGGIGSSVTNKNLMHGPHSPSASKVNIKGAIFGGLIGLVIFPFKFGRVVFPIKGKKEQYELHKTALEPYVVH